MLSRDEINANAARDVLAQLSARGFKQVSDRGALEAMIDKVLGEQASAVADFKSGQGKAMGFLIGQVMQASGGKANPKIIRDLLNRQTGSEIIL